MCQVFQAHYKCLHTVHLEKVNCRNLLSSTACLHGITLHPSPSPFKCPPCRHRDRDRWRRGVAPVPLHVPPTYNEVDEAVRESRERMRERRERLREQEMGGSTVAVKEVGEDDDEEDGEDGEDIIGEEGASSLWGMRPHVIPGSRGVVVGEREGNVGAITTTLEGVQGGLNLHVDLDLPASSSTATITPDSTGASGLGLGTLGNQRRSSANSSTRTPRTWSGWGARFGGFGGRQRAQSVGGAKMERVGSAVTVKKSGGMDLDGMGWGASSSTARAEGVGMDRSESNFVARPRGVGMDRDGSNSTVRPGETTMSRDGSNLTARPGSAVVDGDWGSLANRRAIASMFQDGSSSQTARPGRARSMEAADGLSMDRINALTMPGNLTMSHLRTNLNARSGGLSMAPIMTSRPGMVMDRAGNWTAIAGSVLMDRSGSNLTARPGAIQRSGSGSSTPRSASVGSGQSRGTSVSRSGGVSSYRGVEREMGGLRLVGIGGDASFESADNSGDLGLGFGMGSDFGGSTLHIEDRRGTDAEPSTGDLEPEMTDGDITPRAEGPAFFRTPRERREDASTSMVEEQGVEGSARVRRPVRMVRRRSSGRDVKVQVREVNGKGDGQDKEIEREGEEGSATGDVLEEYVP